MMLIDDRIAVFNEKTRCLELDLRRWSGTKLRYHPWDEGLAIERWEHGHWWPERQDPDLSLLTIDFESRGKGPIHQFLETIPREVREMARHIEHCQTLFLRLLGISEHAMDLAERAPALLALVADALDRGTMSELQAVALLKERPMAILSTMGGITTDEAMQVVERLNLTKLDRTTLEMVRRAIAHPYTIHMLRYHQDITPAGLRFAIRQSPKRGIPGPLSTASSDPMELKKAG